MPILKEKRRMVKQMELWAPNHLSRMRVIWMILRTPLLNRERVFVFQPAEMMFFTTACTASEEKIMMPFEKCPVCGGEMVAKGEYQIRRSFLCPNMPCSEAAIKRPLADGHVMTLEQPW